MSIARAACAPNSRCRVALLVRRIGCALLLVLPCGAQTGCTRASASALLPSVSLGVLARRTAQWIATDGAASERWHALALLSVQFRPRSVAADLPVRAELAPETWIAPCDTDDFICLQEAADAEQELRDAFGELQ